MKPSRIFSIEFNVHVRAIVNAIGMIRRRVAVENTICMASTRAKSASWDVDSEKKNKESSRAKLLNVRHTLLVFAAKLKMKKGRRQWNPSRTRIVMGIGLAAVAKWFAI